MWAWIFDGRDPSVRESSPWSGTLSLPRVLWLGEDKTLRMAPPKELALLRYNPRHRAPLVVPADSELPLDEIQGTSLELEIQMEVGAATQAGVVVCRSPDGGEHTRVYYDAADQALKVDTTRSSLKQGPKSIESGPLTLQSDELLKLHVYLDASVVEVFANDRQAVMRRIYPTREESKDVALFCQGGPVQVQSLHAWDMAPANPW
jgi:beta-fructofuranosidase